MFTVEEVCPEQGMTVVAGLSKVLVDAVDSGSSVGFVGSVDEEGASIYWRRVMRDLSPGMFSLLALYSEDGHLAGTVQLVRGAKLNGRHRAEVCKLLVHSRYRRQGAGRLLLEEAERLARKWGVSLLTLDTESGGAAEFLYAGAGFVRIGEIPDFAMYPDGRLHGTSFYYKRLSQPEPMVNDCGCCGKTG